MEAGSGRATTVRETRQRILDVALDVLGADPHASIRDVAAAAGVVRRTVYGHFPTRADLIAALAERAAAEMTAVLTELAASDPPPDRVWADFVAHLWPLAHRYRVLVALRRSEHGKRIHALLAPVDTQLADLVDRGQRSGAFARHLPPDVLGQVAYATVFTVADRDTRRTRLGVAAATATSLLVLGVPDSRVRALVAGES